ncbi:tripartite motif-containing protein 2-like [Montipora foliosa]|uniref:tripartite motif-containing protein 2-like n=1 Tax=Montipora foliosa TaxID=591990 RepID=UPI0035F150A7
MTSKLYDVVTVVEHEVSCAVCLEEFLEPKCLPNCAHNVCQECLEEMTYKNGRVSIECPVCLVNSSIPTAGVSAFPKNHLLARLVEKNPSNKMKENEFIREALKRSEENMGGLKNAIHEMHVRRNAIKKQAESLKQEITRAANQVIQVVRYEEEKLLLEVDQYVDNTYSDTVFGKQKELLNNLLGKTSNCVSSIEKRKKADKRSLKQVEHLEELAKVAGIQILTARRKCFRKFDLTFTKSAFPEESTENLVGTLSSKGDIDCGKQAFVDLDESYSKENIIKHIDGSQIKVPNFSPFAVTVSQKTGDMAVLDAENKRVHIFDSDGNHRCQFIFIFGDFWDITYSLNDDIVILNREDNVLLHYDRSGNLRKKFTTTPRPRVKFTFLSHDSSGCFLVTSTPRYHESPSETAACVLIYNGNGKLESVFGEGVLSSPKKAVCCSRKFFVPDADSKSVKVFNKNGQFCREIGNGMLEDLAGITTDCLNGRVLVCDCEGYAVHVYNSEGAIVRTIRTRAPPVEIALCKDGKRLVVCFDGEKARFFQILSYTVTDGASSSDCQDLTLSE